MPAARTCACGAAHLPRHSTPSDPCSPDRQRQGLSCVPRNPRVTILTPGTSGATILGTEIFKEGITPDRQGGPQSDTTAQTHRGTISGAHGEDGRLHARERPRGDPALCTPWSLRHLVCSPGRGQAAAEAARSAAPNRGGSRWTSTAAQSRPVAHWSTRAPGPLQGGPCHRPTHTRGRSLFARAPGESLLQRFPPPLLLGRGLGPPGGL